MPLVVVCGHPCSGRSTQAARLAAHLRGTVGETREVVVVDLPSLHFQEAKACCDPALEKKAIGAFRSAVERTLSEKAIVIADGPTHIKSVRYELHCHAREVATPHCVLFVDTPQETCLAWNRERAAHQTQEHATYTDESLRSLCARMEQPDEKRRWDTPLFVVKPGQDLPLASINAHLLGAPAPKPSVSTAMRRATGSSQVSRLESTTNHVKESILRIMGDYIPGDSIPISACVPCVLPRKVTLMELSRWQQNFLAITTNRTDPVPDSAIAPSFVRFLQLMAGREAPA